MTPAPEQKARGLEELAARCEAMGDLTCPMCGEPGFDIPGFYYSHIEGGCEVVKAMNSCMPRDNAAIAAALRTKKDHPHE